MNWFQGIYIDENQFFARLRQVFLGRFQLRQLVRPQLGDLFDLLAVTVDEALLLHQPGDQAFLGFREFLLALFRLLIVEGAIAKLEESQ